MRKFKKGTLITFTYPGKFIKIDKKEKRAQPCLSKKKFKGSLKKLKKRVSKQIKMHWYIYIYIYV